MLQKGGTRRDMIASLAAIAAAASVSGTALAEAQTKGASGNLSPQTGDLHDFDFLTGRWAVRHRYLKKRLVGSADWIEFNGTLALWPILGGYGNIDDNVLEFPSKTVRAVSLRTFNATTRLWSIWWVQASDATIDSPMHGGFRDGTGLFYGDTELDGKPIKARFIWSRITPQSARWEQAMSLDDGKTWEDDWFMDFTRVA
ncbi:DUF1579 domain-containing protein [Sphingomonas sp. URHD0057]|uniref:DUF1579 domain-containing protein n=1 Tax=Sphingomonas sp. URHD0057 TaxID=1380389 RepID=UPI000AEE331C|nr:DUF1579 domain-containing protein [Sphingomonas sp. URHD0057]